MLGNHKNPKPSLSSIFERLYSGVNYTEEEHTCLEWSHLNVMSQFPPSAQKDELDHTNFSEIGKIVFPLYRLHCLSARGRGGGCYLDDLDLDAVLYVKGGNSSFTKSFILTLLSDRVLKKFLGMLNVL